MSGSSLCSPAMRPPPMPIPRRAAAIWVLNRPPSSAMASRGLYSGTASIIGYREFIQVSNLLSFLRRGTRYCQAALARTVEQIDHEPRAVPEQEPQLRELR